MCLVMQLDAEMKRGTSLELRLHVLLFYQPLMVGDCGTWWNDTLRKLEYPAVHLAKFH